MNEGKIAKDASQQESFRYVNCELTVRPEITGSVTLALEHRALAILAKKNANCLANSWLYFMNPN